MSPWKYYFVVLHSPSQNEKGSPTLQKVLLKMQWSSFEEPFFYLLENKNQFCIQCLFFELTQFFNIPLSKLINMLSA